MNINPEIVSPAQALATFRAGRLLEGIKDIPESTRSFSEDVNTALHGSHPAQESIRSLTKSFVEAYRTFSEAQDAAKQAGVIDGTTSATLDSIMGRLRDEFKDGIESMRKNVEHLQAHSPGAYGEFCVSAADRLNRLEQFWTQAYEQAPKAYKLAM